MSRSRLASLVALAVFVVAVATLAAAASVPLVGAQAQPEKVYKAGDGITLPIVVREVKPVYGGDAMRRKVQGSVWLSAVVLVDGTVGDVEITRPLDPDLDREAERAAKQWLFKPGTKDGKPVAVQITIQLTFTLKK